MRAVYPYIHALIKLMLTISCTTASVERCLSNWQYYEYTCKITAEKDWAAIVLMILHRHVKVHYSKSIQDFFSSKRHG